MTEPASAAKVEVPVPTPGEELPARQLFVFPPKSKYLLPPEAKLVSVRDDLLTTNQIECKGEKWSVGHIVRFKESHAAIVATKIHTHTNRVRFVLSTCKGQPLSTEVSITAMTIPRLNELEAAVKLQELVGDETMTALEAHLEALNATFRQDVDRDVHFPHQKLARISP